VINGKAEVDQDGTPKRRTKALGEGWLLTVFCPARLRAKRLKRSGPVESRKKKTQSAHMIVSKGPRA